MALSLNVEAFVLLTAKVVDSYEGCTWRSNGDGTSSIKVVFNYRTITNNLGVFPNGQFRPDSYFLSRGVMVYTYNANGNLLTNMAAIKALTMNGESHYAPFQSSNYVMYRANGKNGWMNKEPHKATIEILLDNTAIKDWPGIVVRAGNYTSSDDVGEVSGGVYIAVGSGATCQVVDPQAPLPEPPATLAVEVAAPDWNLGELPRGDGEKTLTGAEQQLCFTYSGFNGGSRNFVINATSANGVSGNRYLLRNTSKPSQTVPYDLTLDSGSATFRLPNTSGSPVLLTNNIRTCFVPTFRTSVDATADAGDYSDVLSFTVVTKS